MFAAGTIRIAFEIVGSHDDEILIVMFRETMFIPVRLQASEPGRRTSKGSILIRFWFRNDATLKSYAPKNVIIVILILFLNHSWRKARRTERDYLDYSERRGFVIYETGKRMMSNMQIDAMAVCKFFSIPHVIYINLSVLWLMENQKWKKVSATYGRSNYSIIRQCEMSNVYCGNLSVWQ
jgi:hypothetical protein